VIGQRLERLIAQIVVDSLMVLLVYHVALLLFKRREAALIAPLGNKGLLIRRPSSYAASARRVSAKLAALNGCA
jgi:hypothetical protein